MGAADIPAAPGSSAPGESLSYLLRSVLIFGWVISREAEESGTGTGQDG